MPGHASGGRDRAVLAPRAGRHGQRGHRPDRGGGRDRTGRPGRRGRPPQPTAPDAWRPPIPVRHLPLPRLALYEAWHRARRPAVERATGPGRRHPRHRLRHAARAPRRWWSPCTTSPGGATAAMFTRNGVRFFEAALRCVVDDADLVLCPSQATLDDCAAAGIEPARLRHVPWGMTTVDVTDDEIAHVRRRFGLTGRYVLWVGTLEPRKNLPALLDAFGRLPADDVTLVVVGPDGWGESLAAPAEALRDRVRLTGFVPRPTAGAALRGRRGRLLPEPAGGLRPAGGRGDGAGAPVVTSAGTATEELVDGGAGLAVDPRDADAIAGAIAEGARRRRPGRPAAGGGAGPGGRDDVGGARPRRRSPPTRRWWGDEGGVQPALAGARGGRRHRDGHRLAAARSWPPSRPTASSPTLFALDAFGQRYPDLIEAFPHPARAADRAAPAAAGRGREHLAGPPDPRTTRPRPPHRRRAASARSGPRPSSRSTTSSRSTCRRTSPRPSGLPAAVDPPVGPAGRPAS